MDKNARLQVGLLKGAEAAYQHIVGHINTQSDEQTLTNNVLIMLVKNLLERVKTINILSKMGREESITILTRSFLELEVSLKFILESQTDRRALSYYYNHKIQVAKKLIQMKQSDPSYNLYLNEVELNSLRKEVPSASKVEDYLSHFENKWCKLFSPNHFNPKKGEKRKYRKWYSLNWEYDSFKDLAESVGIENPIYHFFYGITSVDVHGSGSIGNMKYDGSNWSMTGSLPSFLCYAIIDFALSDIVYDLVHYYGLMEHEEIIEAFTLMANSSIFNNKT